jgi:hypothetical protein
MIGLLRPFSLKKDLSMKRIDNELIRLKYLNLSNYFVI